MPYSSDEFDSLIEMLLGRMNPATLLDVGPGEGKYGEIARRVCPAAHSHAVEVEPDYVTRFNLGEIYDEVTTMSGIDLIAHDVDRSYDAAILGDVIEHMRKSEGVDLLHFLTYRTRYLIIVYPQRYLQGAWEGYSREAHVSVWTLDDFLFLDHLAYRIDDKIAVIAEGFLREPDQPAVTELVDGCGLEAVGPDRTQVAEPESSR